MQARSWVCGHQTVCRKQSGLWAGQEGMRTGQRAQSLHVSSRRQGAKSVSEEEKRKGQGLLCLEKE